VTLSHIRKLSSGRQQRFTERGFRPYVISIGQLALAWNSFHDQLASLFWTIMGRGSGDRALGLWNAATYDRPKRSLLKAAVLTSTESELAKHPKLITDIIWIFDRANELEDLRNDAVHSPLILLGNPTTNMLAEAGLLPAFVIPALALRNIRAAKLGQKNLLREFRWCRDATLILRDFAVEIDDAMCGHGSWPKRPSLPNRGQKRTRLGQRRRLRTK
jgi:hypothetical protein